MKLEKQSFMDGTKNGVVKIVGTATPWVTMEWQTLFDLEDLTPSPAMVSIAHIDFALSSELELVLAWQAIDPADRRIITPLSGRGKFDFSGYAQGIQNNAGKTATGNIEYLARPIGGKGFALDPYFMLIFDFIKRQERKI